MSQLLLCIYNQTACDVNHSTTATLRAQYPVAYIAISGDFNHVTLDTLPSFFQYVNCPTQQNKTFDLLYANMEGAYTAIPLPPLGRSDHNLVFLQPLYTPHVQRDPITTLTVKKNSPDVDWAMRDCLTLTDWSVFQQSWGEAIDGLAHCYSDYLNFCEDIVVPTKTVRCFLNNKPWITSDVKSLRLGRVPKIWKTSCLMPVPKKPHSKEMKDQWPSPCI